MPVIVTSTFEPSKWYKNPHAQTIIPYLFRKVDLNYEREQIYAPYNDFIDLDWSKVGAKKVAIVLHGLNSDSSKYYVKGMVKAVNNRGWDCVAMNLRGQSGIMNNSFKSYHAGITDDLETVIKHVVFNFKYKEIALIGFSLGGNIVLKYAGEKGVNIPPIISKTAAISTPVDLAGTAEHLATTGKFYQNRLLNPMKQQLLERANKFPGDIDKQDILGIKNFKDFDDIYTARAHGFKDAEDYYMKCSSKQYLTSIRVPTLILTAADDPFLPESCYPVKEVNQNKYTFLEVPDHGGHIGFLQGIKQEEYWHEKRVGKFVERKDYLKVQ